MKRNRLSIIVTEKPSIARKVACATCLRQPCDERECSQRRADVFVHHFGKVDKESHPIGLLRCKLSRVTQNRWRSYWRDSRIDWSRVSLVHSDAFHGDGDRQIIKSLRHLTRGNRDMGTPPAVMEHVEWFTIRRGFLGRDWLVVHTAGNPQNADMRSGSGSGKRGGIPADAQEVAMGLQHRPIHSTQRSTRMRLAHLRGLLHLGRNPNTTIYVATDQDVAGTYLVSCLPGFEEMAQTSQPRRVRLDDMTTRGIRKAIESAQDFDWHNAEAGRLRDSIDYVFGRVMARVVRHGSAAQRRSPGVTLGRTRLLALDCLCRRWMELDQTKARGFVYMLTPGAGQTEHVQQVVREGTAPLIAAEVRRGPHGPAGLLRELLRWDVGTVSTRYKLIGQLIDQGLIREARGLLCPSPKGVALQCHLMPALETEGFSLWDWQQRLTRFLDTADERSGRPKEDLRGETDSLLKEFLDSLRRARGPVEDAMPGLWEALDACRSEDPGPSDNEGAESERDLGEGDAGGELALEGAVPMERLLPYVNERKNLMSTRGNPQVMRFVPRESVDWEGVLRRALLLGRETAFRVVRAKNLGRLAKLEGTNCTLFRAQCDPNKLDRAIRRIADGKGRLLHLRQVDPVSADVEEPPDDAHPPLEIFDASPSDMQGPKAMLLAMEYMRPYEHSLMRLDARDAGIELLQSFECGKLGFERVEPFAFGSVHTFDTVLATMYDRYGMDFETTARLAESLYLAGGGS